MIRYYYIDDDNKAADKIVGFNKRDILSVETIMPKPTWKEQFEFLRENINNFDGLILDLRLDELPVHGQERTEFRGTALAQEIRTRQKEGILKCFPIILFSADEKLNSSLEKSGKDLFDICINKDFEGDLYDTYIRKIISLSDGYKALSNDRIIQKILNDDCACIDSRFLNELKINNDSPIHVLADFIITEFLERQGILIDEDNLAAKLGIDKDNSEEWVKLVQFLSFAKYNGVFAEGWQRWWMYKIEQWWRDSIKTEIFLRSTPAKERVEKLCDATGLNSLVPAEKIAFSESDEFWTVCKAYNRPLDPIDGLLIQGQDNLYPWQEAEYVSIDAALRSKNKDVWKGVAEIEKEHLIELKETLKPRNN